MNLMSIMKLHILSQQAFSCPLILRRKTDQFEFIYWRQVCCRKFTTTIKQYS